MPDINTRIDQLKGEFALGVYSPSQINTILQILDDINAEIGGTPGGSGWAVTGTTTLTGNVTIAQAGNTVSFMNGNVGIGGAAVGGVALTVTGSIVSTGDDFSATVGSFTAAVSSAASIICAANTSIGDDGGAKILISGSNNDNNITLTAPSGIIASAAIPSYANNAAAVVGIGAGKLYYTDVAGEYMVKLSH